MEPFLFCQAPSTTLFVRNVPWSRRDYRTRLRYQCAYRQPLVMTLKPDEDKSSNGKGDKDRKAIEGEFTGLDHVSMVDKDMTRLYRRLQPYREQLKQLNKQMYKEIELEEERIKLEGFSKILDEQMEGMKEELKEISALTGIHILDPETGELTYKAGLVLLVGIGIPVYVLYLSVQILRSVSVAFGHMF